MLNSKFSPASQAQYTANDLNVAYTGSSFIVTKNTTTTCDFKVVDDCMIDGGRVITENTAAGDKITCQVVDKDYAFAGVLYPADYNGTAWNIAQPNGVVLRQFVTDWYLVPGSNLQWDFSAAYPAKIFGNLYIRVLYTSVGTTNDVNLYINYKLHKVLW
jgi:hypothetical protein